MKKSIIRPAPASGLVQQVLATPDLVAAVRALPVETVVSLVGAIGLEDAGEIVALATPAQLLGVLDADLWQAARPGDDEAFDDARFALWLEVLLESGARAACERLLELPEELVTLGFLRQVLVLEMDALAVKLAELDIEDSERIEKALDGCLSQEIEEFRIISRRHDGWDAVVSCLLALDEQQPAECRRFLERLAIASRVRIYDEYGDLTEALDNAEQAAADAEADRDDRRAAGGYVSPASARAFLALAVTAPIEQVLAETQPDPVTRAYFRELAPAAQPAAARSNPLVVLLERAGVTPAQTPRLGARGTRGARRFREAMAALAEQAPALHATRMEEIAYLANVVLSSDDASMRSRSLYDAVNAVVDTCGAAMDHLGPRAQLDSVGADKLFRVGRWLSCHPQSRTKPRGAQRGLGRGHARGSS